jgi:hypothetical protein
LEKISLLYDSYTVHTRIIGRYRVYADPVPGYSNYYERPESSERGMG